MVENMYFPYGTGYIYKRPKLPRKKSKSKLKPKLKVPPTSKVQTVNWCRFWTFGLAGLIFIWALGTLFSDDPRQFVAGLGGLWGLFYIILASYVWVWDWDKRDRGGYDDPPKKYYDVY